MIRFDGHQSTVSALAFSPDSSLLASGAKGGTVRIWDAAGREVLKAAPGGLPPRRSLAWHPSGEKLVATADARLAFQSVNGEESIVGSFGTAGSVVSDLAFVSAHLLAVGTVGRDASESFGRLTLWDATNQAPRPVPTPVTGSQRVLRVAAHLPTRHVHWIVGVGLSTACVWRSWDITKPNANDVSLGKPAQAIAVSDDGKQVAIACDWAVRLYPVGSDSFAELKGHKGQVSAVAFVRGGRAVASASWDGTLRFWDVATKTETARFPVEAGQLTALAASPDGTRVTVGGSDGGIVVIDVE